MSRRSRASKPKLADVAPGVLAGLNSIVEGNEATICSMLGFNNEEGTGHEGELVARRMPCGGYLVPPTPHASRLTPHAARLTPLASRITPHASPSPSPASPSPSPFFVAELVVKLREVMGVNSLSAEMLLARFFSSATLSEYCVKRMAASGKGSESILAAVSRDDSETHP